MIGTFLPLVLLSFTTMVSSCVAYGCTNRSKSGSGRSFFRFPLKKPELLGKWVQAIHRKNWSPNNYSRICSDHFDPSCLVKKPGKIGLILTENAVPSIFQAFLNLRLKTYGKRFTEMVAHKNVPSLRHTLTKTIIFKNQ